MEQKRTRNASDLQDGFELVNLSLLLALVLDKAEQHRWRRDLQAKHQPDFITVAFIFVQKGRTVVVISAPACDEREHVYRPQL